MTRFLFIFLTAASMAFAQDVQRAAHFDASTGVVTLYRTGSGGFECNFPVSTATMTTDQQAAVSSALGWYSGQLASGETMSQAILQPSLYYTLTSGTVATANAGLTAWITGVKADGSQRTIEIDNPAVPSGVLSGLISVWNSLAMIPHPTPAP